ncbi:hypothetical protein H632_c507p1 [Helicosporidium sp. ATCC 50920]|nr:hypothetical protein H632_c507p1 [Helicosporidium sp. ATCC 50920]|eukprot:KDD75767.1 hypothetical protein H632_c507p1 [Helicosporidium sp. ATCC 50920]
MSQPYTSLLASSALYNAQLCGLIEKASNFLIIPFGITVGGIGLLLTAFFEILRRNALGFTAFAIYGTFWLTVGGYGLMQAMGYAFLPTVKGQECMAVLMGILSVIFGVLSIAICLALPVTFVLLAVMFFLIASAQDLDEKRSKIAGIWGLVTSGVALYMGTAFLFEDLWGKEVLPLFYTKLYKAHAARLFPRISHDDPYSITAGVPYADRREIKRGDNVTALSAPSLQNLDKLRPGDATSSADNV